MRYRKSEELKETDIKWIGEIPENWSYTLLRRKIKGHKQGFYTTDSYINEGIKLVRITDLDEKGNISYKDMPYVPISNKDYQDFKIEKKDFLFPRTGSIGLFGVVKNPEKAVFASYLIRFKFKDNLSTNFLKFYFQSIPFKHGIKRNLHGGVNQNIHAEDIKNQYLVIPPKSEQRVIAIFLDHKTEAIDGLIQKKKQLIERLKEKRQALITQAVTKGLDPDVPMKDSGIEWLRDIPEHWESTRLRFLADINTGSKNTEDTEEDGEYPFYVRSPIVRSIDEYSYDEEAVLTSGDGAGVCEIYHYVNGKYELHQRMYRITDFKEILGRYLYYYMIANFKKDVMKFSAKSTVDSLRMHMFKNFPIVYGSKKEQENIVNYIEDQENRFESIISDLENQIEKLKEYRQSLITAAVTGKIDIRDGVEEVKTLEESYDLEGIMPLVMYFLDECHRRQVFYGRLMAVKNYFLLHHLLKIQGPKVNFRRYPKGPHDPDFWDQLEQKLIDKRWITVEQEAGNKSKVSYSPNRTVNYKTKLEEEFEDKLDIIRKVVNELAQHDSDHAEVLATVYAAWNDLLLFDKEPTEEKILHQVLHRWPGGEKQKISKSEWKQGIRRLKSLGIEPKEGFGKPTTDQIELL